MSNVSGSVSQASEASAFGMYRTDLPISEENLRKLLLIQMPGLVLSVASGRGVTSPDSASTII